MSHFTVTVRLTEKRLRQHKNNVEAALADILAPYDENSKDERFTEFNDVEEEYREKYETDTARRVRSPDGELFSPYDERFRVAGTYGTTYGGDPTRASHRVPADYVEVEVPVKEEYPTFKQYMEDYCGYKRDEKTGRYGYWRCKQAKWDWYQVGGRWNGYYPLKAGIRPRLGKPGTFDNKPESGKGDIVRVTDIDLDGAFVEQMSRAKKFWEQWQEMLGGKKFDSFDGPRAKALSIGLLRVEQKRVEPGPNERVFRWADEFNVTDDRRHWSDVALLINEEQFYRDYIGHFDPLVTYAGLDDSGWHEPGRMGWWGSSSDTPETKTAFVRGFRDRFITGCGAKDLLVAVDCHI